MVNVYKAIEPFFIKVYLKRAEISFSQTKAGARDRVQVKRPGNPTNAHIYKHKFINYTVAFINS